MINSWISTVLVFEQRPQIPNIMGCQLFCGADFFDVTKTDLAIPPVGIEITAIKYAQATGVMDITGILSLTIFWALTYKMG
jgi:hypothetical protein